MYFAIQSSRKNDGVRKGRVTIGCERGGDYRYHLHPPSKVYKPRKNTITKKNKCPFKLFGNEKDGGIWKLTVGSNYARHDHGLGIYHQWHSSVAKLSEDEVVKIENLHKANVKPKQILKQLKIENPDNVSNKKHIDNALQKIKRKDMSPYTPIQYLFKLLQKKKYYHWHRKDDDDTNALGDLLFAHPKATDLLRLFPHVVLMDATYRTNRFNLPLLEIIGVSPTGQNFHVAFGFLKNEKVGSYLWVMHHIKLLFGPDNNPGVIVTDRELALMNAAKHVFPGATHLLCKRHIAKDVEKYVTDLTKNKELAGAFSTKWARIVHSLTESDYNKATEDMVEAWSHRLNAVVDYAFKTWLTPYKMQFVSAWTKDTLHFGARTTNRVESAHSQLKHWLGTATGSFHVIFSKIHSLVKLQLDEIKGEMEKSRTTVPHHITSIPLFSRLKFQVSHSAIHLIEGEYRFRISYVGNDIEKCGCEMRTSYGLPCAHELYEMKAKNIPIDSSDIHEFWKTLDIEPRDRSQNQSQRQTAFQWFDNLCDEVRQCSDAQTYYYANGLFEMLHPECTNLKEPIQRSHRGRPKNKPPSSTKRDPSAWETSQKKASQGKSNKQSSKKIGTQTKPSTVSEKNSHRDGGEGSTKKSTCKQNIPTKSQWEKSTHATNQYTFPYPEVVPEFMLQYIENHKNVEGDGNCGFRVIAAFVYDDEEKWLRVRMDLTKELITHEELYKTRYALGCVEDYEKALKILDCHESPAPNECWYCAMRLGPVVATTYQRILTYWDSALLVTFLPLETRTIGQSSSRFMSMARINGNHFISLHLSADSPLPPVSMFWNRKSSEDVKYFSEDIKVQLDKFRELIG